MWQARKLWFRYREDMAWTIQDFKLNVRPGTFTAILGPNGCGKTTLIDLLSGVLKPSRGEIFFGNRGIDRWNNRKLSRRIALVPQDFSVRFAFTVQQVVEMGRFPFVKRLGGLTSADYAVVEEVMAYLDILHMADTPVTMLSGGELQRVALARALAQTPEALLLDEATSNLDIFHSLAIMSAVRTKVQTEGLTAVAAIHDINLAAAFCSRAVFMDKGRLRAAGTRDELLEPALISEVYGVDAAVCPDAFDSGVQISFRLPRDTGSQDA